MNAMKVLGLALFLGLASGSTTQADQPRQYYSRSWQRQGSYYYRTYNYQATPNAGYRHHYVVYYPSKPRYYYYYNPYAKKYWGRYVRGDEQYSLLDAKDQSASLSEIPEEAFPKPGEMPPIPEGPVNPNPPEESPNPPMDKPPDDLPPDEPAPTVPPQKLQDQLPRPVPNQAPPRQVYSDWCKQGGYYYSTYYCQPRVQSDYSCHRCIYYPSQPRYVYYYNPVKRCYWGRYDLEAKGYSLLAEKDRAEKLADIRPEAFPQPAEMPPIPGTTDGTKMELPPSKLPD